MGKKRDATGRIEASFREVWLAGLGAWARAQKKGDGLFRTLVRRGRKYERRLPEARGAVKDSFDRVRKQAEQAWKELAVGLDRQVAHTVKRVALATEAEIDSLHKEVAKLRKSVSNRLVARNRRRKASSRARKKVKK
jgi:poly(hydroxyalkanoate) granule-associated protein